MKTYRLSRSYRSACEVTDEVISVAQMFGIGLDEDHVVTLYEDLEVTLGARRIVYITGESGGGKTSLLRDLRTASGNDFASITPEAAPEKPLVNLFDGLQEAVSYLTYSGISEPFVWLRKPGELSDGQRYRLMLALMMAKAGDQEAIVFLDEFLANLDRETARVVAHQVRKVANATNLCFVVATTHTDLAADLKPNQTVTMRLGKPPAVDRRVVA